MGSTRWATTAARALRVISDPTRLRIVQALNDGERCVSDLVRLLEIDQPRVSHHLGILRASGLVQDRRQGKHIFYRMNGSYDGVDVTFAESLIPEDHARLLRTVGEETRLSLVRALCSGERCVSDLVDELAMDQPRVSHHLGILRRRGLVHTRRQGRNVYYRLTALLQAAPSRSGRRRLELGICSVPIDPVETFRPVDGTAVPDMTRLSGLASMH